MYWKYLAILFNSLDYFLTIFALKRGAREANPIAKYFLKREPLAFIIKIFSVNLVIAKISSLFSLQCIAIVLGLVCFNNILVIIKQQILLNRVPDYIKNKYKVLVNTETNQIEIRKK